MAKCKPKPMVTTLELCEVLGVSYRTVKRYKFLGHITPYQVNPRSYLWDAKKALAALKKKGLLEHVTI